MTVSAAVGIVGLGTMGLGIAQVFAAAGLAVIATDAHEPARASAAPRMAQALAARVAAGKLLPQDRDATLARLTIARGSCRPGALRSGDRGDRRTS